jgi:hypothetical protein
MPDLAIPDGYSLTPPPGATPTAAGATPTPEEPTAAQLAQAEPPIDGSAPEQPAGATPAATPPPATPPPGPPPMPSREQILSRIPTTNPRTGLPLTPEQTDIAQREAMRLYNEHMQRTEETRARLENSLKNGAQMLADGRDFAWNEANVRSLLPPEKADPIVDILKEATINGAAKHQVSGMTREEITGEQARLKASVETGPPTGYIQRRQQQIAFDAAVTKRNEQLFGDKADPANYVALNNPRIAQLQTAANVKGASPQAWSDYAIASLAEQARIGVPPEKQHVMTVPEAQQYKEAIASNPENAPATIAGIQRQTGQAWPHVWSDLVTQGKLPTGYQVVGQLADYDPGSASILARAEGANAKDDKAFEASISRKVGAGAQTIKQVIAERVDDPNGALQKYEHSLRMSSASETQVAAIHTAIEHLAAGFVLFHQEDPSTAADHAVTAVTGHFQFMPNGGARVPADRYADVTSNAQDKINGLSLANVRVPEVYGRGTAAPSPQAYIDELKAGTGVWFTDLKADRVTLMDKGGGVVKDQNGEPISILFSQPHTTPAEPYAPQSVPPL